MGAHSRSRSATLSRIARRDSVVVWLRYQGGTDPAASEALMVTTPAGTRQLASLPGTRIRDIAVAPNGRSVAFIVQPNEAQYGTGVRSYPGLSPPWIEVLPTRPADTAHEFSLAAGLDPGGLTWSPNGRSLAFTGSTRPGASIQVSRQAVIYTVPVSGDGHPTPVTHQAGRGLDNEPSWSPSGRTLAFTRITRVWTSMLADVQTGSTKPLPSAARGHAYGPLWQPHGDLIAVYNRGSYLTTTHSEDLTPLPGTFPHGSVPIGWSPDGRYLLLSANPAPPKVVTQMGSEPRCYHLYTYDTETHHITHIGCGDAATWEPLVDRVAFSLPTKARGMAGTTMVPSPVTIITVSALGTYRDVITRRAAEESILQPNPL